MTKEGYNDAPYQRGNNLTLIGAMALRGVLLQKPFKEKRFVLARVELDSNSENLRHEFYLP